MKNKQTHDYTIFFFLARLIEKNIPPNVKKITPKAPIIYGMPISYILAVAGKISLIRYPNIQDIAEMIMRIIPIIKNIKNPFFLSIFYSPCIIIIITTEKIMSSIAIINNLFFISIFYSLTTIINILIHIRLSFCILHKMKESLLFSFSSIVKRVNAFPLVF